MPRSGSNSHITWEWGWERSVEGDEGPTIAIKGYQTLGMGPILIL